MAYRGPGSVVSACDEFLAHWAGANASLAPGSISVVIANIPAGEGLSFSFDAGLPATGLTISAKPYVVLATGNEHGSNAVAVTRP